MLGDIDENLKPYEYRLFLCKPDRTTIAELPEAYDKNLKLNYGSVHELSFTLPFKIEKNKKFIRNKHVDILRGHYLIRLERKRKDDLFLDKEYFIITKPKNITDNGKEAKHIQCCLLPYEIRDKIVRLYSGTKKLREVLAETLEHKTDWTVGHVDLEVSERYRTFDESQTNLLDFIYKVADTFDVVIKWDTENKEVNFYKNESYGNDRGLLIEYGKYLKTLDEEPDFDNVVTRLYCYGKDDLSIRSVNPSGMDYIESFDYYMHPFERDENNNVLKHSNYMSDELCHAILDYYDLLESKKGEFNNLLLQKQAKQELLTQKQNELVNLNTELKIILDNIDTANSKSLSTGDLILQKTAKETEIATKQGEINQVNTEINNINTQISNLRNIISLENNFNSELIIERNQFVKEYVWSDDNYIDAKELYEDGINKLMTISQPLISYEVDIVNFLKVVECQRDWEKLVLGDIVTIRYPNFNIDIKAKIIGIENSLDDYNIKLTIANSKDVASGFLTLNEMINRSYSSSIQVDMSKYKWNEADSKATEIEQVINQTWDATARNIKAGVNNSVEINERGIRIVDPSNPQNVLVCQAGILGASGDGGLTWKHAVTPKGIVGESIFGKLGIFAKVRADQIVVGDDGEKITDDLIEGSTNWNNAEQNAKDYADAKMEGYVKQDTKYNNVIINPTDGVKVYHSDDKTSYLNGNGLDIYGGNIRIFDQNDNLVMDGRGLNPLEVSGWGITNGLTFEVESLNMNNYIAVQVTQQLNFSGINYPFYVYVNDVSKLGNSGILRIMGNQLTGNGYLEYDLVDSANKRIRVIDHWVLTLYKPALEVGDYLYASIIDGVQKPNPSGTAVLKFQKGAVVLKNGIYVKFEQDFNYNLPVNVNFQDSDGWEYRVLWINSNGEVRHASAGTLEDVVSPTFIKRYPPNPRYQNLGSGTNTPDPNAIVLGAVLCGTGDCGEFSVNIFMHPDFRDDRAVRVVTASYLKPYITASEKSLFASSMATYGSWAKSELEMSAGEEYVIAIPIGLGKRFAIVSFSSSENIYTSDDSNTRGAVAMVGLKDPYYMAWQPRVSVGYGDIFIDSFYTDTNGDYIIPASSLGWSYRRIKDCFLKIGADGQVYLHVILHQYVSSENRNIRISWFAM